MTKLEALDPEFAAAALELSRKYGLSCHEFILRGIGVLGIAHEAKEASGLRLALIDNENKVHAVISGAQKHG